MKKRNGFTLIEMLVVITMLGMLMAMLAGALVQARESARKTRAEVQLREIVTAWEQYQILNPNYNFPAGWQNMDKNMIDTLNDPVVLLGVPSADYIDPWREKMYQVRRNNARDARTTTVKIKATVHFNNRKRE